MLLSIFQVSHINLIACFTKRKFCLWHFYNQFSETILCAEPHLQHTTGQVVSFCGAGRGSGRNRNDASMTDSPPAPPHENNNNNFETVASVAMDMRNGITKHEMERSRNFNETASVALMDHLHSLLCAPPSSWKEFLECHFYTALPRYV